MGDGKQMKDTAFALFSTYNKIKFDDGSERLSFSAPFIVSNDNMLSRTIAECRKLKLPFRLVGFFRPLVENERAVRNELFLNTWRIGEDGLPCFGEVVSAGNQFAKIRSDLFEFADKCGFELLYQGFLDWKKEQNDKGDFSNGSQNCE